MDNKFLISQSFAIRLLRNLIVPTFVLDAEGRVQIWNKACEKLTGVEMETLIGTDNHWQAFYNVRRDCLSDVVLKGNFDELDQLYDVNIVKEGDDLVFSVENWCEMPSRSGRFYLAIDAGPIYDDNGKIIAIIETLRDQTEQRLTQDKLEKYAQIDGLTGLSNRRMFDKQIILDWNFGQRQQLDVALLFLDVDYFKQFNDTYGHNEGDECLKRIASAIADNVKRPSDSTARYGGEEFIVILPGINIEQATAIAECIRESVLKLNIEHTKSSVGRVSISIGVASMMPLIKQPSSVLVEAADKALYRAKTTGRNKVFCA
jgi:diguanylate cyclase (GGDEF)-like protein